jgi:phosphoribosylglycinamide formyltransferase-1
MSSGFRPPRIAVLTSSSAPGILDLASHPSRGTMFEFVGVVSSECAVAEQKALETCGVPVVMQPIRQFHDEHRLPLRNLQSRTEYDDQSIEALHRLDADYIILAGYHYILSEAMLAAFPQRIFALHDGDLTLRDTHGRRELAGLHAVRNAILAGANETRSAAYIVTRDIGEGPLFLLSRPYPIAALARDARNHGDIESLIAYADLHGPWMRRCAWGEMLTRIAEILAAGTMSVFGDVVWVDGVPGPCRMGDAPNVCYEREETITRGIPSSCPFITR